MDKINCVITTWKEMEDFAKKTSENIKKSNFYPDVIIGLSRGGLVPARMFCDFLHVKSCFTVKVDHWGMTATKDGQAKLSQRLDMDLAGKKVLIVDDITDTGQSMELAKKLIDGLNPKEVKTATLIHLSNSKYIPDFFGYEMPWGWIVFPWNRREDLVNLIKKILSEETEALDAIKKSLKNNCDIDIEKTEIEEVLEHIRYLEKINEPLRPKGRSILI
jgi:hypoxanthine phosphoribosyltransferase